MSNGYSLCAALDVLDSMPIANHKLTQLPARCVNLLSSPLSKRYRGARDCNENRDNGNDGFGRERHCGW